MVRRSGDKEQFPGGRAAERLRQFEIERGLPPDRPDEAPPDTSTRPTPPKPEGPPKQEGNDEK